MMVCVMKMLYFFFLMKKQLANCALSIAHMRIDRLIYSSFADLQNRSFDPKRRKRNIWKLGVVAPNV